MRPLLLLCVAAVLVCGPCPVAFSDESREEETAEAVADYIRALKGQAWREQHDALTALREIGPDALRAAVPEVLDLLATSTGPCRVSAAHALHEIGAPPEQAVPALFRLLDDTDPLVRRTVPAALSHFRDVPKLITPAFVKALADKDDDVRERAASVLGMSSIEVDDMQAARALLGCFESASGKSRVKAGEALSWRLRGGAIPQEAPSRIVRLLRDEDPVVRMLSITCLAWIKDGREDAEDPLVQRLKDDDARVKARAAWVFAVWERRTPEALRVALALATGSGVDEEARRTAFCALVRLPHKPDSTHQEVLTRALSDHDLAVRSIVVTGLRRAPVLPKEALPLLIAALSDADVSGRIDAAWTLGIHGIQIDEVVRVLVELVDMGRGLSYGNCMALLALGEIGPPAKAAIPHLERLQTGASADLRRLLTKTLEAIKADEDQGE